MKLEGDNMANVKRTNRSAVLRNLHENGGTSRKRLSETVKLTPATISKIVSDMIEEGLVTTGSVLEKSNSVGRREVMVMLNPHARCALGILINIGEALLSAVWLDGSVIFTERVSIERRAPADATLERLTKRLLELAEENGLEREKTIGIGVAIRGITGMDNRTMCHSYGALKEENYPLAEKVEQLSGMKVIMANNVRSLFLAQMFNARDKSSRSQYFLRCEYGIGAALSINDKIWLGDTGHCSEIGHVPVVRRGGRPCACGKSGCLETIASPNAILNAATEIMSPENTPVLCYMLRGGGEVTLDTILEAARSGDEKIAEIVDNAIQLLASTLKTVIYTVNPAKIVLYGRLFENSYYLSHFLAEMEDRLDPGVGRVIIEKSPYNLMLEEKAACILMVEDFFEMGGLPE